MSHTSKSVETHEGSEMLLDNHTFRPNFSEDSTVNASDYINSSFDYEFFLYDFEEFYIYGWPFLVILTFFANMLAVAVFVRKSMRTTTNLILLFITISDSLTGLVTLPTYVYVYTSGKQGSVFLNEVWCEAFMICKLYISRAFHAVSIWLTLLLGFQRFCFVWYPFKANCWFTTRRTLIAVAVINICAFVIHTYHLNKTEEYRLCEWDIEDPCIESCSFLWITLLLVNILPCVLLLVITILMIQRLFHQNILKAAFTAKQSKERDKQNTRTTIIVVCVVIILLIPEIPYGIFLLVTVIKMHSDHEILNQRENHIFFFTYEIAIVLSFHANVWVYIIMNRRFSDELKSVFLDIMRKLRPKRATVIFATVTMEKSQIISNNTNGTDTNKKSTFV